MSRILLELGDGVPWSCSSSWHTTDAVNRHVIYVLRYSFSCLHPLRVCGLLIHLSQAQLYIAGRCRLRSPSKATASNGRPLVANPNQPGASRDFKSLQQTIPCEEMRRAPLLNRSLFSVPNMSLAFPSVSSRDWRPALSSLMFCRNCENCSYDRRALWQWSSQVKDSKNCNKIHGLCNPKFSHAQEQGINRRAFNSREILGQNSFRQGHKTQQAGLQPMRPSARRVLLARIDLQTQSRGADMVLQVAVALPGDSRTGLKAHREAANNSPPHRRKPVQATYLAWRKNSLPSILGDEPMEPEVLS